VERTPLWTYAHWKHTDNQKVIAALDAENISRSGDGLRGLPTIRWSQITRVLSRRGLGCSRQQVTGIEGTAGLLPMKATRFQPSNKLSSSVAFNAEEDWRGTKKTYIMLVVLADLSARNVVFQMG
jgi:hypothetical protein